MSHGGPGRHLEVPEVPFEAPLEVLEVPRVPFEAPLEVPAVPWRSRKSPLKPPWRSHMSHGGPGRHLEVPAAPLKVLAVPLGGMGESLRMQE